jgi:hypothetical protein
MLARSRNRFRLNAIACVMTTKAGPSDPNNSLAVDVPADAFFHEAVTTAIETRRIDTSPASAAYVASLLTEHARSGSLPEVGEAFGVRLARAMQTSGGERFVRLRALGDDVLFFSGFFAEHLERRGVGLDYAAGLGQVAYGGAASVLRGHARQRLHVFEELSDRFSMFVELLRHIADTLATRALKDQADVLALYERWSRTGSGVLAEALARLGLTPQLGGGGLN